MNSDMHRLKSVFAIRPIAFAVLDRAVRHDFFREERL